MNETFGTTFIFSTHDPDIVEEADHIIRLRDGRIVEDRRRNGTSVDFAAAPGADEPVGATGTEGGQS
jgi:putative ABC transport system ATP-binding protein